MAYLKGLKLTYSRKRVKDDLLNRTVMSSEMVYDLFREMQDETREKLICVHLNPKRKILYYEVVSIGTAHRVLADPVEIFRGAIVVRASSIVIVHNHPSGDPTPSKDDKIMAEKVYKLGKVMNIPLSDFIIIGDQDKKYFSFDDKKMFLKMDK